MIVCIQQIYKILYQLICFNLNMLGRCTISKEGNPAQVLARKIKYFTLNSKIKKIK